MLHVSTCISHRWITFGHCGNIVIYVVVIILCSIFSSLSLTTFGFPPLRTIEKFNECLIALPFQCPSFREHRHMLRPSIYKARRSATVLDVHLSVVVAAVEMAMLFFGVCVCVYLFFFCIFFLVMIRYARHGRHSGDMQVWPSSCAEFPRHRQHHTNIWCYMYVPRDGRRYLKKPLQCNCLDFVVLYPQSQTAVSKYACRLSNQNADRHTGVVDGNHNCYFCYYCGWMVHCCRRSRSHSVVPCRGLTYRTAAVWKCMW